MGYDVVIVGGGITGAGVARDCAMRGLITLLLERGKPGMATTVSSTHLIHGGLRYLLYDRLTTHTTCWDSGHIIRIAQPLLTRVPILWPVYTDHAHGIETVETLIEVYDGFSKMKGGLPHLRLSAEETLKVVPSLKPEGLVGAVSFDEWWVDPVGLVEANLDSARRHGAQVWTGEPVDALLKNRSAVCGVRANGREIEARLVINAAGPWVDKVARMAGASIALRLQKGTHLGYRERLVPVGLLLEAVDRGRYVFVVPSPQGTLVGPTDLPAGGDPDAVSMAPEEISYLLASVRRSLPKFPLRHDFVTLGARPILGQAGNEKLLSREYEVFDHRTRDGIDGLLTIGGGKMSDFRVMGQAVVDAACQRLGARKPCSTHLETLAGAPLAPAQEPPQPSRLMKRFLRRHPRAREAHAIAYLAAAFARHLARRAVQAAQAPAAELKRHYGLTALLLLCAGSARAAALRDGWQLQSSCVATQPGELISSLRFEPQGWHKTAVPSTVLAALVADKTYPDPYVGMNLRSSIPGMDYPLGENFSNLPMVSTSPFYCSWWYRKELTLAHAKGRRQWLRLDGINYRANLWLNGRQVADSSHLAGAWRRYELDVTSAVVSGRNALAVEVFAPAENDLAITWVDWNPSPPDKDMGLFGPVSLEETGPVAIQRPAVFSELSQDLSTAKLTAEATLVNQSDKPVRGSLSASFDKRAISEPVELAAGESRVVRLSADRFPQLALRKPRLWWPYQMGKPNLYSMRLIFKSATVSDEKTVSFGVRRIETEEAPESKAVIFKVNGRRLLVRGGGWASDMLLRQSKKRLHDELAYVQNLNLNTVRLEGKLETDDFFDEADRRGILVMAGWCCCDAWERWKDWKEEQYSVSAASLEDQIARLRGHPSLLVWLNGSDNAPPKVVEQAYLDVLRRLSWPNPVLPSAGGQGGIAGHSGVKMEGPYDYVPPGYWLSDTKHGGAVGFATEVSPGPAIPALESLKRMLGEGHLWPVDSFWNYHAGGTQFAQTQVFDQALAQRYGKPKDLADYVRKAQAATYEGQRAMFEAFARNKYRATGVIQWMINNAWPSTIWHLYDYFLVPGGGFFGARAACEAVHAQYSYDDRSVVVVSNLAKPVRDVRVEARVFDLNARARWTYAQDLDLEADASTRAFVVPQLAGLTTSYFLRLSLIDTDGKPISDNTYWLSTSPDTLDEDKSNWYLTPQTSYADFTGLQDLPPAALKISSALRLKNKRPEAKIVLRNVGRSVAFMARLRLTRRSDGREIAPTFWSDNYVTLLPDESKTVTAAYDRQDAEGGTPSLAIDGWNLQSETFALAR